MCLADFGADVIKVEDTGKGDDLRSHQTTAISNAILYFLSLNRNKRSISINMAEPDGQAVIHDLLATADVLVENFRTGVMEKYGVGYEDIKARYPRLVYCSISGYGREGSQARRAAYDPVVQAESGQMATNGSMESGPMRTGLAVTDTQTGHYAVQAILAALFARERSGRGQYIEVPLFDVAVSTLSHYGIRFLMDGTELPRVGNGSTAAQPIGVFPAKDGKLIQVTCASERSFVQFAKAPGGRTCLKIHALPPTHNAWRTGMRCTRLSSRFWRPTREIPGSSRCACRRGTCRPDQRDGGSADASVCGGTRSGRTLAASAGRHGSNDPLAYRYDRDAGRPHAMAPPMLAQHSNEVLGDVLKGMMPPESPN